MKFNAVAIPYRKTTGYALTSLVKPSIRILNCCRLISPLHGDKETCCVFPRHFSWKVPFIRSSFSGAIIPSLSTRWRNETASKLISVKETDPNTKYMSERLAGACLDLLKLCGGPTSSEGPRIPLDPVSKERIRNVTNMLLHESHHTPANQFDIVYHALCSSIARKEIQARRSLMVVLEFVVPMPVYRLFEAENLVLRLDDDVNDTEGAALRSALQRFIHSLLGEIEAPDGLTEEEVLRVYTEDFENAFPAAALGPAFMELKKNAVRMAMRAKLIKLLARLCVAFDKERTGKVKLVDLQYTAEQVLGKEKTSQLLADAPVDSEGNLAYAQLTALLMHPPLLRVSQN